PARRWPMLGAQVVVACRPGGAGPRAGGEDLAEPGQVDRERGGGAGLADMYPGAGADRGAGDAQYVGVGPGGQPVGQLRGRFVADQLTGGGGTGRVAR